MFLRAIWPQAAPAVTAYTLYSFECCVRAASVLGFVGAGGIGYEISISMRLFDYGQVLTLVAAFVWKRVAQKSPIRRTAVIVSLVLCLAAALAASRGRYAANVPHEVEALEDSIVLDVFSPARDDWRRGEDAYLRR